MSLPNMLGSAKSGVGNIVGSAKSGMSSMVGSAKSLAQNFKGKGGAAEDSPKATNSPQPASPSAREMMSTLRTMFPAWDPEAIKEVILNSRGNMDVAIQTMLMWTADDNGTSKAALREQEAKASIVPEDLIPPPVEERKLLDTILEKRLTATTDGEKASSPAKSQVLNMMKSFAKSAHDTVRKHTSVSGGAASSSPETAEEDLAASRAQKIEEGKQLLNDRLSKWNLTSMPIEDDGNCQFRSFSMELWGTQAFHLAVRSSAVSYLRAHAEEYAAFVPEDLTWDQYLDAMARPRYWGDQLTLIAACQAYGCVVHMISTDQENWHHVFEPAEKKWPYRRVFLAYISQVHYNVIKPIK